MAIMGKLYRRLHAEDLACAPSFSQVKAEVQGGSGRFLIGFGFGIGLRLGIRVCRRRSRAGVHLDLSSRVLPIRAISTNVSNHDHDPTSVTVDVPPAPT